MNKSTIGSRIRNTRKERGLTIQELATLVGSSQGHISNIEKGTKEPGSRLLSALKKHLNTTSDYLLDGEVEQKPKTTTMKIIEIVLNLERLDGATLDAALNYIKGLTGKKDSAQTPLKKREI